RLPRCWLRRAAHDTSSAADLAAAYHGGCRRIARRRSGRLMRILGPESIVLCASLRATPASETAMALSTVGPYRILERLGAGANGEVYLAEDTRLHRRVALKTLAGTARLDASELRRRLMREARAAAR